MIKAKSLHLGLDAGVVLGEAWSQCELELPEGWVIGGVLMRADIAFVTEGEKELYFAIAVQIEGMPLGPVPEVRGSGDNPTAALIGLASELRALQSKSDPT